MPISHPSPARRGSAGGVIFVILIIVGGLCYMAYQADQRRQREIEETRNALGVGAALLLGAAASSGNHQAPAPAPSSSSGNSAENQKLLDMWNKNQNPGMSFSCSHCGGSGKESFNDGSRSPMNRPCGWCNGTGKMQKR